MKLTTEERKRIRRNKRHVIADTRSVVDRRTAVNVRLNGGLKKMQLHQYGAHVLNEWQPKFLQHDPGYESFW